MLLEQMPRYHQLLTPSPVTGPAPVPDPSPAISVRDLTWNYRGSGATALRNVSFELPRGARCLLVGANGAGKTTLLKLLGGKSMVPRGSVEVLGYSAFHDTELNTMLSLLSGDWTRQVACVGNGVPFQADFSVGFMANGFAEALVRDGADAVVVRERLARLTTLLDLNMEWRLHKVSDGQRRRAQLLLKLLRPSELLLLDEVTTDLDVLSRQSLLQFLREESEQRNTTVVYSTHIFDGLDDWPTYLLHVKSGTVAYVGPISEAPRPKPSATTSSSGSLFSTVRGWLDEERQQQRSVEIAAVTSCPTQADAFAPAPSVVASKPSAPSSFASKFDRFGGSGRQGMYAR